MGIINVTPDSFSDGGRYRNVEAAVARAERMAVDGADWLDIGGESTRPGAAAVSEGEEIDRVIPAIEAIAARVALPLSIDTMKPAVARAAVAAGATMWNDVTALSGSPDSLDACAQLGCDIVLMHMRGDPRGMQFKPRYLDVVAEVVAVLSARAQAAMAAGVARDKIWLDPGIGFGKTPKHNLALIAAVDRFTALDFPVLIGASRKGFIGALDQRACDPGDRLGGSIAAALAAARAGAAMVRVHDLRETVQALTVAAAIGEAARD